MSSQTPDKSHLIRPVLLAGRTADLAPVHNLKLCHSILMPDQDQRENFKTVLVTTVMTKKIKKKEDHLSTYHDQNQILRTSRACSLVRFTSSSLTSTRIARDFPACMAYLVSSKQYILYSIQNTSIKLACSVAEGNTFMTGSWACVATFFLRSDRLMVPAGNTCCESIRTGFIARNVTCLSSRTSHATVTPGTTSA